MALCLGLPGWAVIRKVKPIWILLKQQTVSGSGISWAISKSAPRSRQITIPAPHHSVFTDWMLFLPPNQQRQSTEGDYITNQETYYMDHFSTISVQLCWCKKQDTMILRNTSCSIWQLYDLLKRNCCLILTIGVCLQCFDTVGWAAGKTSGL